MVYISLIVQTQTLLKFKMYTYSFSSSFSSGVFLSVILTSFFTVLSSQDLRGVPGAL